MALNTYPRHRSKVRVPSAQKPNREILEGLVFLALPRRTPRAFSILGTPGLSQSIKGLRQMLRSSVWSTTRSGRERKSKHAPRKVQTLFAKSLKNGAPEKIRTPNLLI